MQNKYSFDCTIKQNTYDQNNRYCNIFYLFKVYIIVIKMITIYVIMSFYNIYKKNCFFLQNDQICCRYANKYIYLLYYQSDFQ